MTQRFLFTLALLATMVFCSGTASASTIDLSKALIIGNGPKKVIEFTDPDCPFCRKASAYFHNRRDITRYVFLTRWQCTPMHAKKYSIFCPVRKKHAYIMRSCLA